MVDPLDVLQEVDTLSFHGIASHAADFDLGPLVADALHDPGGVGLPGGLACEDVQALRPGIGTGHQEASIWSQTMAMTRAIITNRVPFANRSHFRR